MPHSQALNGEPPEWFNWALAQPCESGFVTVQGANIEWAAWGERGQPGILLMTGNGAHVGWWRAIAPFLAKDHRVAALSWSGMGQSDWREAYAPDLFQAEAVAVAEEAGLFEGDIRPAFVGHSFGGFITVTAAANIGQHLRGAIFVDARLRTRRSWGAAADVVPPYRIYATREEAIARFRLQPAQPQANRYLIDMLADEALCQTAGGWTWRADPDIRAKTELGEDLTGLIGMAQCPLAFVRGELSATVTDQIWEELKAVASPGTPFIEIPAAHHHVMADQPIALIATLRALLAAHFTE
jgi:pimeloyl-ACP methyl ester carboxylesterase